MYFLKILFVTSSPRRIKLLKKYHLNFEIIKPAREPEITLRDPCMTAILKAERKIHSTLSKIPNNTVVIAADTVIYIGGEVIGKPKDINDAINILKRLSGKTHSVITALVLKTKDKTVKKCVKTLVRFKKLSMKEIMFYVKTGEPLDKAGAYAIQGYAAFFVKGIKGDYYNILGLPLNAMYNILKKEFKLNVLTNRESLRKKLELEI
ncbi:MAG: septum formation protein Maf [Thermoprotei archaeon]|nr:MAG: septum formation protein Maf [Thermoprotei archaeon]